MPAVSQGWRWGLVLSAPAQKCANLMWTIYHSLISGSSAVLSKQGWRETMVNLKGFKAVKPLNILTDFIEPVLLFVSLKEKICFFAFLQGVDEVDSSKEGENKKTNKHVREILCKENITTLRPMQGCLNHVSWNARCGFPESASQSTSKGVSLWKFKT